MKSFFLKLRKAPLTMLLSFLFTLIIYSITYAIFLKSLLSLVGIETLIRIIVLVLFGLFGIVYLIVSLRKMIQKKKMAFVLLTLLALIFSCIFLFASYTINTLYQKLDSISSSDTSTYTTVILTLKDTEFSQESKIGMITNEEDRSGYILPMEWIKKENIPNEIEYRNSYEELLSELYNKTLDAIFITKDYITLYGGEEPYLNLASETKVVKEYSKQMKTEESELLATTKSLTEPFTVLVLGVDSESTNGLDANAAFNGDTLILVTFNPKTLTATIFSIPRDMYVPIYNASGTSRWYGKINSSAALGTAATIQTIEHLTDIEIDYFVKVNFRGVVDLVDALGGIDVDVEAPNYSYYIHTWGEGRLCEQDSLRDFSNMICMNTGWQHLNGEQALAYARNRHGYTESDIARNRHQQQIIEAAAKKVLHNSNLSDFQKLLDTISKNIATNMKTSQILSFYQSLKGMLSNALQGQDFITIQKTQLSYYNLDVNGASCLGYYEGSMQAITKAMKENLGLLSIDTVKTFHYDYSEDYEQSADVIGKGIYTGERLYTMPNLKGKSISDAQAFANQHNLDLTIQYTTNEEEMDGIILDQDVAPGTLTKSFDAFTIYVNRVEKTSENEDENEQDETDENEESDFSKEDTVVPGNPTLD